MRRRELLACMGSLLMPGCSAMLDDDPNLPEPVQMDQPPWVVAPGMSGLATLWARVLVLSRRDYPAVAEDALSAVSPVDLAVAWGAAARRPAREAVELTQSDRRYNWRVRQSDMDVPGVRRFTSSSGNWHMIPASADVGRDLSRVARGDVIQIEGDLVQVTFTNGVYYRSSTSRDDTGGGACEIVRARSISIERRGV